MTFDFQALHRMDGSVAIVTGGAAGIGLATAQALASAGARVVLADLDFEAARKAAAGIEGAAAAELDVACEAMVVSVFDKVANEHGHIDILVNNAGIGARMPSSELPLERFERALEVGVHGTFLCSREAGRRMVRRGSGAIVNVSSIMGLVGNTLYPNIAYHAAKGAVVSMTRALACEWAMKGVRVNAVAPTFVDTALIKPLLAEPGMETALIEATPMKRFATAREVASAIAFLASDAASMITGVVLPVDGGWTAR